MAYLQQILLEMLLRHPGWQEAAGLIVAGVSGATSAKTVTGDLAGATTGAQETTVRRRRGHCQSGLKRGAAGKDTLTAPCAYRRGRMGKP